MDSGMGACQSLAPGVDLMAKAEIPLTVMPALDPSRPLLFEVSWEACQQVGGIYTVLRSKVPFMVEQWGDRYCVVGPYNPAVSPAEFEEQPPSGPFGDVVKAMREAGWDAHFGRWLVTGRPQAVLVNPACMLPRLAEIKYAHWEHLKVSFDGCDNLMEQVLMFGALVEEFTRLLSEREGGRRPIVAQFHEWMGATALPAIKRMRRPVGTVFTTHATQLCRYLAMTDMAMYDHLPGIQWRTESRRFNIETQAVLEWAAAQDCNVFTTVSDVTALECEHVLKRKPDVVLPNGLNIQRFVAVHEFQSYHRLYKGKINDFVMGHFFPSYTFDLDQTMYFFTSGRYEYTNKGFDLTIEAMARLNHLMKEAGIKRTVVFFLISRQPYRSINADVLNKRAVMEEMRKSCEAIKDQVGERLFVSVASGKWPQMDELVDDYWRLRLRRTMHAWKTRNLPSIVTHDLWDDHHSEVLNFIRQCNLINRPEDPVKVVYHPDFVASTDPLFGIDYDQFVRGCHLGIFPSRYEPWGYAPLECVALGIPTVTSDLAGFGAYVKRQMPDHTDRGIMIVNRRHATFQQSAGELASMLFDFLKKDRRDRISQRNKVESSSEHFDWHNLGKYYNKAHAMAMRAHVSRK